MQNRYVQCEVCGGQGWFPCQHNSRRPHVVQERGKPPRQCGGGNKCTKCNGDGGRLE